LIFLIFSVIICRTQKPRLVFIGLRPDKIWEPLYMVYGTFSVLNFLFNYMSQEPRQNEFYQIKVYNI